MRRHIGLNATEVRSDGHRHKPAEACEATGLEAPTKAGQSDGQPVEKECSLMPGYIIVILFGFCLAVIGYNMAFRQIAMRRLTGRPAPTRTRDEDEDPLAYALRISGVMIMAFGIVIGGMVAVVHFS